MFKKILNAPIIRKGKDVAASVSEKIEDTVWGKELWKQQYMYATRLFYLEFMNKFIGE